MTEEQISSAGERPPPGNPWKLGVLGGFRLTDPNGVETSGLGKFDRALLVYLALSGRQRHPRAKLAALLWPNRTEALHSLSVSLNLLRRTLADKDGAIIVPKSDPLVCRFDVLEVDASAFEALSSQDTPEALEQAETLYGGDLFDGISVKSEEFDRWIARERKRLRALAVDCFCRLMRLRRQAGQSQQALATAQRILALDELCQDAHRTIIGECFEAGQWPAARKHAQSCEALLRRENVEAEPETLRLLQEVRKSSADGVPQKSAATGTVSDRSFMTRKLAIAVLPFEYLSGDAKWARLADGLTEDVTNNLCRSRDLFVIARNSAAVYKGKAIDVRKVGRDLGVTYVLEGTIQSEGDSVRVTVKLVHAEDRQVSWTYPHAGDASAESMFRIQDDVTAHIAGRLLGMEGALNEAEREKLRRKPPADLTAYDLYLSAMQVKHDVTRDDIRNARDLLNRALQLDPGLARAHVGLAWVDELEISLGYADSLTDARDDKFRHATKAIALDPKDGEAYAARGTYYADIGKVDEAREDFRRAVDLAPNNADILLLHGANLPQLGEPERAVEAVRLAIRLNPYFPRWYHRGLRNAYFFAGQFDDALRSVEHSEDSTANDRAWRAVAFAQSGRMEKATEWARMTLERDPDWSAERHMSDFGKFARDKEPLLFAEGARKAGLPVCATIAQMERWPDMTPLPGCEEARTAK